MDKNLLKQYKEQKLRDEFLTKKRIEIELMLIEDYLTMKEDTITPTYIRFGTQYSYEELNDMGTLHPLIKYYYQIKGEYESLELETLNIKERLYDQYIDRFLAMYTTKERLDKANTYEYSKLGRFSSAVLQVIDKQELYDEFMKEVDEKDQVKYIEDFCAYLTKDKKKNFMTPEVIVRNTIKDEKESSFVRNIIFNSRRSIDGGENIMGYEYLNIRNENPITNQLMVNALNNIDEFVGKEVRKTRLEKYSETSDEKRQSMDKLNSQKMAEDNMRNYVLSFLDSGLSVEEFCDIMSITTDELSAKITTLHAKDKKIKELAELKLNQSMTTFKDEMELLKDVITHRDPRTSQFDVLAFHAITDMNIDEVKRQFSVLKEDCIVNELVKFKKRRDIYDKFKPIRYQQHYNSKHVIGGKEFNHNGEDVKAVEKIIDELGYPHLLGIYLSVRKAYVNDDIDSVRKEEVKKRIYEELEQNKIKSLKKQ